MGLPAAPFCLGGRVRQIMIWLALVWAWTGGAANASLVDDETRQRTLDILPKIVAAKSADAHLHIALLESRYSKNPPPTDRAEILKELIFHYLDIAEPRPLESAANRALELASEIDDPELAVYGQLAKATYLSLEGEILDARDIIENTRTEALSRNAPLDVFFADAMMAVLAPAFGDLLQGLSTMTQAIHTLPDTPRGTRMKMLAYLTLAYTFTNVEEVDEIIANYEEALKIAEREGIAFDRESALFNIASSLNAMKDNQLARQAYLSLEEVIEQTGRDQGRYYMLFGLAWIAYDEEDFSQAVDLAMEALTKYESDPLFDIELYDLLAISHAQLGAADVAREYQQVVLDYYASHPDLNYSPDDAVNQLTNAYITAAEGRYKEAFEQLNKARRAALDAQFQQFHSNVSDLRTNLETLLAKQRAEEALEQAEEAYTRLAIALIVLFAIAAIALLIMQRRHAVAMQRSVVQAEMANKTKSEFLANMSHELRTPLNAILGFSEMMEHEVFGALGARQYREYVGHINESGRLLLDIINDILDLSKVEAGRLNLKEQPIELRIMLEDVTKLMSPRTKPKDIALTVSLPDKLPLLHGDRRLFKQVLLNVVSNAVKFTDEGGRITLKGGIDKDDCLYVAITDNGIGMTPDEIAVALTPFGQAGSTMTRSHEGTGLGLPLVKSLMELHKGELIIDSEKDVGTTVTLRFPAERTLPSIGVGQL